MSKFDTVKLMVILLLGEPVSMSHAGNEGSTVKTTSIQGIGAHES